MSREINATLTDAAHLGLGTHADHRERNRPVRESEVRTQHDDGSLMTATTEELGLLPDEKGVKTGEPDKKDWVPYEDSGKSARASKQQQNTAKQYACRRAMHT